MSFSLILGLQNLELQKESDPKKKIYSVFLADTVIIEEKGAVVLTEGVRSTYKDISYWMEDEADDSVVCSIVTLLLLSFFF